ncbi:MAG: 2-oxoacid:ferredoxin oxidoreductase subunit beta [Armatimonadetes bacterium]|nr:MAG: 2-oxoacid:ferredoxin oxidoreductase subunit beta [Armatimonadota bacterium]
MTATYLPADPIWCAGCGHFGVQTALSDALADLNISKEETLLLAGIGCSGTIQNNLGTYGYHALHGRVIPTATGAWRANPDLTVIAAGGDGDGYAIGMGHLIHAFRRNPSITYLVMNNGVYGLTKGQDSPTRQGTPSLDAVLLGLSILETTFIARAFTSASDQLRDLTAAAIRHAREGRGFAFLEILSPCVTYNDTYPAWDNEYLDLDIDDQHDPTNRTAAFTRVADLQTQGRIPIGMIYRDPSTEPATFVNPSTSNIESAEHATIFHDIMDRYRI